MPGVRLRHTELRGCTYTLIHQGRPLVQPVNCLVCGQTHYHKTYHLGLDAAGEVVVSETVYQRLQEAGLDGLRAVSEEKKPQPITIDVTTPPKPVHVVSRERRSRDG